jgi:hypothetical protein
MWEPQPLTTLRASKACRGENFTFYLYKELITRDQSRRMRCARTAEKITCNILVENPKRKRPPLRPRRRSRIALNWNLKKCERVWSGFVWLRIWAGFL